jgi:hypothetical protein
MGAMQNEFKAEAMTMRTNTLKTLVVAGATLFGAAACTDLVVEPESTVTAATIFNDESSYEQFLAKIYGGLALTGQQGPDGAGDIQRITDEGFSNYIRLLWVASELPTDEAVLGWGDDGLPEMHFGTWGSANQWPGGMYSRIFFQVGLVNEFLRETTPEKLDERDVSAETRADIVQFQAEARFMRALSYWHGIDMFGSIPLVDENFPLGTTPPEQATRSEIYDFVVAELNDVRGALPAAGAAEYGRADQGAVDMLLAKLYLNAEVYTGAAAWGEALAAAQRVIESGAYELDDEYTELFLADNHTSPELIFTVPQDGINTRTWGGTTFLAHAAVGGNMDAAAYGLDFAWWGLRIQPEVVELFPVTGDGRADDVFFTDGQSVAISDRGDFFQGLAAPKYRNVTSDGTPGSNLTHVDADYVLFRLADAYLMYAEAHLRGGGGDAATALGYVNALRERAYGDASGNITAGELTLDFMIDERARELYWEGHRRTDLIRFGLFTGGDYVWTFKGGSVEGSAIADTRALFAIPATELSANPNLVQNPGY